MFPKQLLIIVCSFFCTTACFMKNINASKQCTYLDKNTINPLPDHPMLKVNAIDTARPETISYSVIDAEKSTYGYDIFINKKRYIHQLTIPGMSGNSGFSSKAGAEKTAKLVIEKIRRGEMPPTISRNELQHLHIIQ